MALLSFNILHIVFLFLHISSLDIVKGSCILRYYSSCINNSNSSTRPYNPRPYKIVPVPRTALDSGSTYNLVVASPARANKMTTKRSRFASIFELERLRFWQAAGGTQIIPQFFISTKKDTHHGSVLADLKTIPREYRTFFQLFKNAWNEEQYTSDEKNENKPFLRIFPKSSSDPHDLALYDWEINPDIQAVPLNLHINFLSQSIPRAAQLKRSCLLDSFLPEYTQYIHTRFLSESNDFFSADNPEEILNSLVKLIISAIENLCPQVSSSLLKLYSSSRQELASSSNTEAIIKSLVDVVIKKNIDLFIKLPEPESEPESKSERQKRLAIFDEKQAQISNWLEIYSQICMYFKYEEVTKTIGASLKTIKTKIYDSVASCFFLHPIFSSLTRLEHDTLSDYLVSDEFDYLWKTQEYYVYHWLDKFIRISKISAHPEDPQKNLERSLILESLVKYFLVDGRISPEYLIKLGLKHKMYHLLEFFKAEFPKMISNVPSQVAILKDFCQDTIFDFDYFNHIFILNLFPDLNLVSLQAANLLTSNIPLKGLEIILKAYESFTDTNSPDFCMLDLNELEFHLKPYFKNFKFDTEYPFLLDAGRLILSRRFGVPLTATRIFVEINEEACYRDLFWFLKRFSDRFALKL